MVVRLFYDEISPPARAVLLTLKVLGVSHEVLNISLREKQHLKPEFISINPQHTVPTIQDKDGFVIWESHAIMAYLADKYPPADDNLYPHNLKERAVVNQRLHFDNGILYANILNISRKIFVYKTINNMSIELIVQVQRDYDFLEKFLAKSLYIAGDHITIADLSIITSLGPLNILVPIKKYRFPLLAKYIDRCEANIPHYKLVNEEALKNFTRYLKEVDFEVPVQ